MHDCIQKQAICDAIQNKVFILTGGPGTGKTTVIKGIIAAYALLEGLDLRKSNLPILLLLQPVEPLDVMNELTGLPSATIHRHLGEWQATMIPAIWKIIWCWFYHRGWIPPWWILGWLTQLFSNIFLTVKSLIVGDSDQLPSVSPGQVLADLLHIPLIPQTRLEKIYRQSEESNHRYPSWVRFDRESCQLISPRKSRPFLLWNC